MPYVRPRALQRTFYGSGAPDNLRLQPATWAGAVSFAAALYRASGRELADCDALVSSWCVPSGWAASRTAAGRPHLCICHATDIRWLSRIPGGGVLARQIATGATAMWFLSTPLRDRFFETAGLQPSVVTSHVGPMPIEPPQPLLERRSELRRRLGIEGFTLLFLGRLVPVKRTRRPSSRPGHPSRAGQHSGRRGRTGAREAPRPRPAPGNRCNLRRVGRRRTKGSASSGVRCHRGAIRPDRRPADRALRGQGARAADHCHRSGRDRGPPTRPCGQLPRPSERSGRPEPGDSRPSHAPRNRVDVHGVTF